jgi:hypothetical protein
MKLLNYESNGSAKVGFLKDGEILQIGSTSSIEELLSLGTFDVVKRKEED